MAKKKTSKISASPSLFDAEENEVPIYQESPPLIEPVVVPPPKEVVKEDPVDIPKAIALNRADKRSVKLRNGEILTEGDEVFILPGVCKQPTDKIFIIERMNDWDCESGMMCIVYEKENIQNRVEGVAKMGIDANWFKKI